MLYTFTYDHLRQQTCAGLIIAPGTRLFAVIQTPTFIDGFEPPALVQTQGLIRQYTALKCRTDDTI